MVVSARYSGGGGNTVQLKHAGGFETYYLHLSSFGPGIRAGARVSQGQLIGRVGSTGSATGPHLDYRLKRSGTFVNPGVGPLAPGAGRTDPRGRSSRRFTTSRDDAARRSCRTTLLADGHRAAKPDARPRAHPLDVRDSARRSRKIDGWL